MHRADDIAFCLVHLVRHGQRPMAFSVIFITNFDLVQGNDGYLYLLVRQTLCIWKKVQDF